MATKKYKPINTDLQLDNLKPAEKVYGVKVGYTSGLYVRVGKSGVKSFRWDRGRGQKPRHITYGQYPALSLQKAKQQHDKLKQQYKDGIAGGIDADEPKTIEELAKIFYAERIVPVRKRPESVRQILDHDILPAIGTMKLATVKTLVVRRVVRQVVERGATAHAGTVLSIMKQLMGFGTTLGVVEYNTALPLQKIDLGIETNHRDRTLTHDEIKLFWNVLDASPRLSMQKRVGLKLLILLGLRSGELRQVRWEHIDFDKKLLTIPVDNQKLLPQKRKKAKPFTVPLDVFAIELFQELKGLNDVWVFPGRKGEVAMNKTSMAQVVRSLLSRGMLPMEKFTPHDLRRTMRSNLSRISVQPHIAELCLNHSLGEIIGIYDHYDYLNERREALERWSQQLQVILGKRGNVLLMEKSA